MTKHRWAVGAVAMVIIAACGGAREPEAVPATTPPATPAPTAAPEPAATQAEPAAEPAATEAPPAEPAATEAPAPTEPAAPAGPTFGDMPWPCGPAAEANADDGSETGVTAESVTIGAGDDAGFAGSPGLSHEMTDAVKALVAECNELGGIHGRQINLNYYDAKLFEAAAAMQSACDADNFFLVGQGWAFDSTQEEIRLACNMPSVPGYSVSAAFAHGQDVYVGVPNPSDETPTIHLKQLAELFPEETKAVGAFVANFAATIEPRDKLLAVADQYGWSFVSTDIVYNPTGEADWTPFVKQLSEAGTKLLSWTGTCLPNLQQFAQTAKANGLDVPIVADANHYTEQCAAANTDGALDKMYVRLAYVPFEEASEAKAVQDYLDLMAKHGGDVALLGMQAGSSFLLWATAAAECGATLTRACVLENLKNTHEWTAGGMHASADPGGNHPPECSALFKLEGTTYVRVAPTEPASYECGDDGVAVVANIPALDAALLDENRISQQFTA